MNNDRYYKEYLQELDNYIIELEHLEKEDPEEASKKSRDSLIRSGVLDAKGNVKKHICE